MTRCSGGDGGDDDGDDGDDDPNEVQLDDGDDGVDFPLPEGISACRRALFSLVFSAPQRRLCLLAIILWSIGFRDEEVREGEEARGGCGPSPHKAARPGWSLRRPMGGPMAALLGPSFWLAPSSGEIRPSV